MQLNSDALSSFVGHNDNVNDSDQWLCGGDDEDIVKACNENDKGGESKVKDICQAKSREEFEENETGLICL